MLTYFTNKLKEIKQSLERATESVIKHANSGTIDEIKTATARLSSNKYRLEEFSKDACKYLAVVDLIELLNLQLLSIRDCAYVLRYERPITTTERDLLCKISYEFRECKIK